MHVCIAIIDEQPSQQGSHAGFRVTFRSNLTYGAALLVDNSAVAPPVRGKEIHVEVEAEAIEEVRVLSAEKAHECSFTALLQERCYRAVGKVVVVYPPSEDDEVQEIGVGVDDAFFFLPDEEINNTLSLET